MFTKEQIDEIKTKLSASGQKDSQLPESDSLTGDEQIPVVQKNRNVRLGLKLLSDWVSRSLSYIFQNINRKFEDIDQTINNIENTLSSITYCTFSVNTDPYDAIVTLNGERRNSITVKTGDTVKWEVYREGYKLQSGYYRVVDNYTLSVILEVDTSEPVICTLTVNASPEDATVIINNEERHSIQIDKGNYVYYKVVKEGYISVSREILVISDISIDVVLQKEPVPVYTFSISSTPEDALVTINNSNTDTVTVEEGTEVTWKVERDGYVSQEGKETVNSNTLKTVDLAKQNYTVNINPTPSDATVTINDEEVKSVTVPYMSEIKWTVTKDGYVSQEGQYIVEDNDTLNIVLLEASISNVTLNVTSVPSDATVRLNGIIRNTITVAPGTQVEIEVSKSGYNTYNETYTVNETETKNIELIERTELSWSNLMLSEERSSSNSIDNVPATGGDIQIQANITVNYSNGEKEKRDVTSLCSFTSNNSSLKYSENGIFTWSKNDTTDERTAMIQASLQEVSGTMLTASIYSIQQGTPEVLSVSPMSLSFEDNENVKTITITSNTEWTIQ